MHKVEQFAEFQARSTKAMLPVSVIVAVRNEEKNLPRCLEALREAGEVYVVDSGSTNSTRNWPRLRSEGGSISIPGGWPRRQWAMDNLPLAYKWISCSTLTRFSPELAEEIQTC